MEQLLPKVGRYEFTVEPFHCDFSNHYFLGHLGNAMLNAADYHSDARGYGMSYLNREHKTWVLSRLAIEMEHFPVAYDRIAIETWVDGVMRFFTSRNFAVTDAATGQPYGYGRSVWAMIDTDTRQPCDILALKDGLIEQYLKRDKPCPIAAPGRVKIGTAELTDSKTMRYSDIDINGHVNSVKYIEHVLDLWGLDWHRSHRLRRFEIAYVAESHEGDTLDFFREQAADGEFRVRVAKHGEGTDVCRCTLSFDRQM